MVSKVKLPKVTENDEEQVVTAWLKKAGELVRRGEPLVEVTTSKATFELESPRTGLLRAVLAAPKSSLPVGYVIALIGDAGDDLPDVAAANRALLETHAKKSARAAPVGPAAAPRVPGALRATPAARRVARERGLDLARVQTHYNVDVVTESLVTKYLEERGS